MSKNKEKSKVLKIEVKNFAPTLKNIKKLLLKIESDESDESDENSNEFSYLKDVIRGDTWKYDLVEIHGNNQVFIIDNEERYGGCEGGGEEHWVIFSLTDKETSEKTYWRIPGYYASFDGAYLHYNDVFQVEPYEKTVRDWRAIKN